MSNLSVYDKTPANAAVAVSTLRELLEKNKSKLEEVAPKHLSIDRLMRIAITATSRNETLLQCTPTSILGAVMQGAMLGLEAGGALNDGFIVPYRNNKQGGRYEAQFIIGYRGLITLARRSGQILSIEADVVYEKDEWTYNKTEMGTTFRHVPSEDADPGPVLRAYAVARLKDSPVPIVIVMPRREIESIRLGARRGDRKTPWDSDYAQMACKTAIRRIAKYLPMSVELAETFDKEDNVETNDVVDVTPAAKTERKKLEPKSSPSLDHAPEPSEPEIDASESQEEPAIEPIADVLRGIEALRTDVECAAHSELLKAARWESEEDRKQAAAALKARWKVIIDEVKAKAKAAAPTPAASVAPAESKQQDLEKSFGQAPASAPISTPEASALISRCDECGLLKGHDTKCSKKDEAPKLMGLKDMPTTGPRIKHSDGSWMDTSAAALDGGEIQGRERQPGEEG